MKRLRAAALALLIVFGARGAQAQTITLPSGQGAISPSVLSTAINNVLAYYVLLGSLGPLATIPGSSAAVAIASALGYYPVSPAQAVSLPWAGTGFGYTTAPTATQILSAIGALPLTGGTLTGGLTGTTATFSGALTPSTTAGVVGTTAANNTNAGSVGEYLSAINSAGTTMVSATPLNLTSLVLTAGDWDVTGSGQFTCSGGATIYGIAANTTSATFPSFGQYATINGTGLGGVTLAIPVTRFNVSVSTTIYGVGQQTCASGTLTGYAMLRARRIR